jgi:agmatine/peptidylarginine deiminase
MRRLPAEWEAQRAVLLTWPHAGTDWAPFLAEVEQVYLRLAQLITRRQELLVVCRDLPHRAAVQARLSAAGVDASAVHCALAPSDDSWSRDHGPITVLTEGGRARLLDFRFNGWGGKYPADLDDQITAHLWQAGCFGDAELEPSELVLEGGAIETDGAGTLLAVRRTLLDPARNGGWDLGRIEAELTARLGIRRCHWLDHGQLSGDDTDGHIDTLARFCTADTICHATPHPSADAAEADSLAAMIDELHRLRRADGKTYHLIPLPAPAPITDNEGAPLPAGYANFLLINGALLLPTYGDAADITAAERLASVFPGRSIEPVDCRALIRQGGSLHCVSMQLPRALPLSRSAPNAIGLS